jgi:DNA-directed RNA polymerase subunit RPC12/RpoP
MYRLLDQNVEELDKEELAKLKEELEKTKADNPLLQKLLEKLSLFDEGKVKKSELPKLNHSVRSLLTVLRRHQQAELQATEQIVEEEGEREKQLKDAIQCPVCGHFSPKGSSYCSSCGKRLFNKMDKVCFKCNGLNPHGAKFCMQCGARFDTGEEAKFLDGEVQCPFCGRTAKGGVTEKSAFVDCSHCGAEWGGSNEQYEMLLKNL